MENGSNMVQYPMNLDILIGTRNPYKAEEMICFLEGIDNVNIHFLKDSGIEVSVEENMSSLEGNARKKAEEISKFTDNYVLSSDGGIDIPGLGEKWDILRNQRIVGEKKSDLEKAKKLLDLMNGLEWKNRKAEYSLALAMAYEGECLWSFTDVTEKGYIADELEDEDIPEGRWVGHLWFYPEYGKVFNKLNKEEKVGVRRQADNMKRKVNSKISEIITRSTVV